MKTNKPILIELRSLTNTKQTYWTYSNWEEKEIDGEKFTPVTKFMPNQTRITELHYVRSNSLEQIREF